MSYKYILITGTIRGGTAFIRNVLAACGVQFRYESRFHPTGIEPAKALSPIPGHRAIGEISGWGSLSARHLGPSVYVVQQIRNPLKVAASFNGFLSLAKGWKDWIIGKLYPEFLTMVERDRGLFYWLKSHESVADRADQSWLVENFCLDDLRLFLRRVQGLPTVSDHTFRTAIDRADRNMFPEEHKDMHTPLSWNDFSDKSIVYEAQRLADSFGYEVV